MIIPFQVCVQSHREAFPIHHPRVASSGAETLIDSTRSDLTSSNTNGTYERSNGSMSLHLYILLYLPSLILPRAYLPYTTLQPTQSKQTWPPSSNAPSWAAPSASPAAPQPIASSRANNTAAHPCGWTARPILATAATTTLSPRPSRHTRAMPRRPW
jgi:hypothetical protein